MTSSFPPLKLCMGLVVAPLEFTTLALAKQLRSIKVDTRISTEPTIDWKLFFGEDGLNYNILNNNIALFKVSDNLTVYTSNASDGWWALYSTMMEKASLDGYFFCRTLNNEENYHIFEMRIWRSGVLDRYVRALKAENGWEFLNEGNPASFERTQLYEKRKIADRLNRETIDRYSAAAGFPINSVVEYQGPAVIFSRPTTPGASPPNFCQ